MINANRRWRALVCLGGLVALTGCPDGKTKKTEAKKKKASSEPEAKPEEWAGTYESDRMTLVLKAKEDGLEGSVTFKGTTYAVEASGSDTLEGTFKSGEASFDLTVRREDDKLVLATGGVDHVLTPEAPANPLAAANPLGKPDAGPTPRAVQVTPRVAMGAANPRANPDHRRPRPRVHTPPPTVRRQDPPKPRRVEAGGMPARLSLAQARPAFWKRATSPWTIHRASSGLSFRLPKGWVVKDRGGNLQIGNSLPALQEVDFYVLHKPIPGVSDPASRVAVNAFAGTIQAGAPTFGWKRISGSWRDYSIGTRRIGVGRLRGVNPQTRKPVETAFYLTKVGGRVYGVMSMGPARPLVKEGLVIGLAFCWSMSTGTRAPSRRPVTSSGNLDPRLLGEWFKGRAYGSGGFNMATYQSMYFKRNGGVMWGTILAGGGPNSSLRAGRRKYQHNDRWKTSGNKLTWYYASGKVEVYKYEVFKYNGRSDGGLALTYANGTVERWKRP